MTGFGAAAPEPAPQQAAPVTLQQPGTGGHTLSVDAGTMAAPIATPEATPAPAVAQPAPAATAQTAPGVVSAFEGSIDERLNKLLG